MSQKPTPPANQPTDRSDGHMITHAERWRQAEQAMLTPEAQARRKRVQWIIDRYGPRGAAGTRKGAG